MVSLPQGSGTCQDVDGRQADIFSIVTNLSYPRRLSLLGEEDIVGRRNVMTTGQPVITGQLIGGNVPDVTIAQEEQGIAPTVVMPFSGITVSDGTDPVQATVDFYGTGTPEADGMTAINGVPGTGSTWQTGYVSPAALTAILQGAAVQMGAIGQIGSSGVPNPREAVDLAVTDQITGETVTDGVTYDQVPIAPLVVSDSSPTQTVNYGGSVHPFSGVTITDPNATAAYQPILAVTFDISSDEGQTGIFSGTGLGTVDQPWEYIIQVSNPATLTADLRSVVFTAADQATALPSPVTISWGVQDSLGQSSGQQTTTIAETIPTPPSPPVPPVPSPPVTEVTQYYQDILQRSPDPGGMAYWTGEINSGAMSGAVAEQNIINSSEAQDYVVPIVEMYTILGRAPDQAGLNGWVHALEGGASLPDVALAFISSPEGQGIYGAVPTAASSVAVDTTFTADLYKNILGRAPDAGGLNYWVNELQAGLPAQNEALAFIQSSEAQSRFGSGSNAVNSWLVAAGNGTFNPHLTFGSS